MLSRKPYFSRSQAKRISSKPVSELEIQDLTKFHMDLNFRKRQVLKEKKNKNKTAKTETIEETTKITKQNNITTENTIQFIFVLKEKTLSVS